MVFLAPAARRRVAHLRRSSPRSSPTTTRSRCRPPTIGLQLPEPRRRQDPRRDRRRGARLRRRPPTAPSSTLGIYPDEIDTIPANVTGSIVPKTLFGEKYVALEIPEEPGRRAASRPATRSSAPRSSIEVEKVLSDLYPLLRTVQPAELNMTLNALATALEGRGERARREPRDRRLLPQAAQPADPALVEDLRLTAAGLRHLRRRDARDRADPAQHGHDHRHPRGPRGQAERALRRRRRRSPTPRASSSTQNGDNLIRLGELGRAAAARCSRKYAPEFPCLLQGHRQRRQAARPRRSAASRCTSSSRRCPTSRARYDAQRRAAVRRRPRPRLPATCRTRRGPRPTRSATSRTSTTASTSRPARAPAGSRPPYCRRARLRRQRRGGRPAAVRCSARSLGVSAADVPDLGRAAGRPDGPRRGGERCDEAPRQEDRRRPDQAADLHRGHHPRHRRAGRSPSATSRSAAPRSTRPSSSTRPASSRATTSGSPASRSARSRTSRSSTAPAPW